MHSLVAQFGDGSSVFGTLGLNGQAFLFQLITFVIVFLVLKRWAFGPILSLLDKRRQTIEDGIALGEKMEAERAKLSEETEQKLSEARARADGIIADAEAGVRDKLDAAEDAARKRADVIMAGAYEQIKQTSSRERQKLQGELVGLVSDATEAIIGKKADSKLDAVVINQALKGQKAV